MKKILTVAALLILAGFGCNTGKAQPAPAAVAPAAEPSSKVWKVTPTTLNFIQAERFSGEVQDGFSIVVPTGTASTCNWTWLGDDAHKRLSKITSTFTAQDKHYMEFPTGSIDLGTVRDFKVSCVDNLGNAYAGKFPGDL